MPRIAVCVDSDEIELVDQIAAEEGARRSDLIRTVIGDSVERHLAQEPS